MAEKHPLQQVIEDADFECRSYSGRGMYGRNCLAVEIDRDKSIGDLFAGILEQTAGENTREIQDGFRDMAWDSMGLGTVYYFPQVPYVAEEPDVDEKVSRLPRESCIYLLEALGIECYDSESTEVLREAVASNVEDGTIDLEDVEAASA